MLLLCPMWFTGPPHLHSGNKVSFDSSQKQKASHLKTDGMDKVTEYCELVGWVAFLPPLLNTISGENPEKDN